MLDEKIKKSIRKETQELLNVAEEIRLVALSNKKNGVNNTWPQPLSYKKGDLSLSIEEVVNL